MTAMIIERSRGVITPDLMNDFSGEIQIIHNGLTQRDGCAVAAVTSHVAAGIVEKWRRQHMSDFDDGAIRAPSLELWGESIGQTRVVIPGNGDVFLTSLPC